MNNKLKIIWTKTAKEQLKSIFYYHSNYSVQSALTQLAAINPLSI